MKKLFTVLFALTLLVSSFSISFAATEDISLQDGQPVIVQGDSTDDETLTSEFEFEISDKDFNEDGTMNLLIEDNGQIRVLSEEETQSITPRAGLYATISKKAWTGDYVTFILSPLSRHNFEKLNDYDDKI